MKQVHGLRLLVSALILLIGAFAGEACVMCDPRSGMCGVPGMGGGVIPARQGVSYVQQPVYGGQVQQPVYAQQQTYIQQPAPQPMMMGNFSQTEAAAQQRAQMVSAGVAPPVAAYPDPARPACFIHGQASWSMDQCMRLGGVMP